jgi:hypothetical protein
MLPMSLLFALFSVKAIGNLWIAVPVAVASFLATLALLANRHLKLREYWVKHVYRAFLVMQAGKKQASPIAAEKADG